MERLSWKPLIMAKNALFYENIGDSYSTDSGKYNQSHLVWLCFVWMNKIPVSHQISVFHILINIHEYANKVININEQRLNNPIIIQLNLSNSLDTVSLHLIKDAAEYYINLSVTPR